MIPPARNAERKVSLSLPRAKEPLGLSGGSFVSSQRAIALGRCAGVDPPWADAPHLGSRQNRRGRCRAWRDRPWRGRYVRSEGLRGGAWVGRRGRRVVAFGTHV